MEPRLKQPEITVQSSETKKPNAESSPPPSESEKDVLKTLADQGQGDTINVEYEEVKTETNPTYTPTGADGNPIDTAPEPEPDEEGEEAFDGEEFCSSLAQTVVAGLDVVNTMLLPPYYESLLLGNVNKDRYYEVLDELEKARNTEGYTPTFRGEKREIVQKIGSIRQYEKKAPFKPEEAKKLETKLDKWFRSMGWDLKVPPVVEVIMVLFAVQKDRLMPLWKARSDAKADEQRKQQPQTKPNKAA